MKNLELEGFGLVEMSHDEMREKNGGWVWFPVALAVGLILSAINNFGDIADGFQDGVNGRDPRYHHN